LTTAKRLEEIADKARDLGVDGAAEKLGVARETVRRAVRYAKAEPGKSVDDQPREKMLERLAAAYSNAEIKAMLDDKSKHHDTHGKTAIDFSGEWYKFGVLSDLHIGSNYTNEDEISSAIEDCNQEGCKMLLLPGDLTEGMSGRDGHLYELTHAGYAAQRAAAVSLLSAFNGPVKAISGNHDLWYMSKGDAGALIVEDICQMLPDAEYLGEHEGSVYFNGARVDLWHGEDGSSYALSYRIQKIVESLEGGTKPNMLIAGHDHKAGYFPNLRNIQAVMAGCLEHQTPWMRRKKLAAFVGYWMIEIKVRDGHIIKVRPEWTSLYGASK
jgi:predicted phosphodiesterase